MSVKGPKILVVDDHAPARDLVKTILHSIGFGNVSTAGDGGEAIRYISFNDVDLVVCDWNMPFISGIEVLKAVRSMEDKKHIPFIMLTAEAYRENVMAAVELGVSAYVSKPFTPEVLGDKVKEVISETYKPGSKSK